MKKHTIAVYGTLKQGRHNYDWHLTNAEQISKIAETKQKFAMYSNGIPYVVPNESKTPIHVEVYKVSDKELKSIDRLEGYPGWYDRKEITILVNKGEKNEHECQAWLYFMSLSENEKKNCKFIKNGIF